MRFSVKQVLKAAIGLAAVTGFALSPANAAEKKDFKVAWSIYVGWMPWGYAADSGIVKKWADKYGINIEVKQFNDYVESINQYTAGAFDAVTVTNMDALSIPAAGGVDTTAVIVGDFSNGNDAVILKNKDKLADIKGQNVNLVEFSVSHYLLARGLESAGLAEKDLKVVNTSDADMAAAYKTADVSAVVTWKPIVSTILESPDAKKVFDSSQIPGEIIDLMVVNTAVLKDNPKFAKALAGIWYETLATLKDGTVSKEAMAKASGTDLKGFDEQLATTKLFSDPKDAVAFTTGKDLKTTTERVSKFLFEKSLLGKDAKSDGAIGVEFPDKTVFGDKSNVKFRYDATFMKEAEDGKL
ncbi:putative urea ABC transporter substrate-binding protein [Hyphomicrobium facile]|uniref:NitT/TauT family transport system substrate-binding protein n=1 Tax=Hyphomicrobium facile TaxID=51670 RepID=A0A1I7NWY5_9HYPH|nr:putative urea ABC transporter substrate-binding protein [Hyphomicrobium facile]SFV39149.1 NitT/TauT family transport system substrate-binding protein [Hyphomicrobium facile]